MGEGRHNQDQGHPRTPLPSEVGAAGTGLRRRRGREVYESKMEHSAPPATSIWEKPKCRRGRAGPWAPRRAFTSSPPTPGKTLWSPEVSPLPTEVSRNPLVAGSSRESSRTPSAPLSPSEAPRRSLHWPFRPGPPPPKPHHVDHVERAERVLGAGEASANHLPSFGGPAGPKDLGGGPRGPSSWTPSFCLFKSSPAKPNPARLHRPTPALDWRGSGLIQGVGGLRANHAASRHWPACRPLL